MATGVRVGGKPLATGVRAASLLAFALLAPFIHAATRSVAITFDDLPAMTASEDDDARLERLTRKLLAVIGKTPAIGFVNEDKLLDDNDVMDPRRVALLKAWLDAGHELGNHTFSHVNLHEVTPAAYEEDILRGEAVTRPLMAAVGKEPHWFRHPYLNTGTSLEVRQEIEHFLGEHGYRVAPVTIDDSEWIFGHAYDRAHGSLLRWRVRRAYLRYMEARFRWYERKSRLVFGREIPQILLLHATMLNADAFRSLARRIRRRGYRFITVDEAMADPAYSSPDSWVADGGLSWIVRWGVTRGISEEQFNGDPPVPKWVQKLADIKEDE